MIEFTILKQNIDHPFFMKLHYSFKIKDKVYLVMDIVQGGDLFTYLSRNYLRENNVRCLAAQIILAVEELHKRNIIYRDLKLENIFLDKEGNVVLADFGLSVMGKQSNAFCGTRSYMAPEMFKNTSYNFMIDWYSLGVLMLVMITGKQHVESPQSGDSETPCDAIPIGRYCKPVIPSNDLSYEMDDLLHKLLEKNPYNRLGSKGAQQIKNHPFFRKMKWNLVKEKVYSTITIGNAKDKYDISNFEDQFTDQNIDDDEDIKKVGKVSTLFYFNKYDVCSPLVSS